jgi:ABC-type multidrug transport system ATPase subunit
VTLCRALKRIAADGTTVVLSIHQPRAEIFDMMTQIVFLTKDGRVAYCGPPRGVRRYLQTDLAALSPARTLTRSRSPHGRTPGGGPGSSSAAAANPADALLDLMAVRKRFLLFLLRVLRISFLFAFVILLLLLLLLNVAHLAPRFHHAPLA